MKSGVAGNCRNRAAAEAARVDGSGVSAGVSPLSVACVVGGLLMSRSFAGWVSTVAPHSHYSWRPMKRSHTASVEGDALLRHVLPTIDTSGSCRRPPLSPHKVPHLLHPFGRRDIALHSPFPQLQERHV